MIKAVIFDIGETLIKYNKPLNWSVLYRPAFENMVKECGLTFTEADYKNAIQALTMYNTRTYPREYEVKSDDIFIDILSKITCTIPDINKAKHVFYSFFRNEVSEYPEAEDVLSELKEKAKKVCTLSDVAYGMDNKYVLEDIKGLLKYIDFPFTSIDIGFRKPNPTGIFVLAEQMLIRLDEILFVGDEEKDIKCAKNARVKSVLINRSSARKCYGQVYEIKSLKEIMMLV